ncbi:MAG: diguanylate cyclase, partial [Candidatus Thiodiazotropha sp.]
MSDRYHEHARGKIGEDFKILSTELESIRSRLRLITNVLASQPDVVSVTSLVDTYQDIDNYRSLVFDGEKERLALMLSQQAQAGELQSVAIYDSSGRLIAYSCTGSAGERFAGYSTVVEGQRIHRGVAQDRGSTGHCPQWKEKRSELAGSEQAVGFQVMGDELTIISSSPVMHRLSDGSTRLIGSVHIHEHLNETFFSHLREHTDDDFMLDVGKGVQLGSFKQQLPAVSSKDLPRLIEVVNGVGSESGWLDTADHFIGLARMDMVPTGPAIFAFGISEEGLAKDYEDLKKSIILILLLAAVIALPFGLVVINRVISWPIEQLAFGVRALERGEYVELESEEGEDELSKLAKSFNAMSAALQSREEGLRKLSMAVEQSPVSVMISNPQGVIEYVNESFVENSGYSKEEVIGGTPSLLKSGHTSQAQYKQLWETVLAGEVWRGQLCNKRKDGTLYWEEAIISPVKDSGGQLTHLIAVKEDITIRKSYEEQLLRQANYDSLTDLPNRLLALDRLSLALAYARRHELAVAVLFVDLDNFKRVNDTLGHEVGDKLLVEVAKRFSQVMRDGDTVARLGGDEFLIVAPDVAGPYETEKISEKIIDTLVQPIELEGREIYIGTSVGVSLYPDDGQDSSTLMRNADTAMYMAKESGRNTFRFFTSAMNEYSQRRMEMEPHLRLALDKGEFSIHFQPQVCALTGNTKGV